MRTIYGCVFFSLAFVLSAFGQEKCKSKIEYTVIENASGYSIALQSNEQFRNLEVQLYDVYEGKTVQVKQVTSTLRNKPVIFTKVKPSRYYIYVKHDECSKLRGLGELTGIKVGNIE
jgi:hypothetical protein